MPYKKIVTIFKLKLLICITLIVSAFSCAPIGKPMPKKDIDRVVSVWRAAGRPWTSYCADEINDLRLVLVQKDEFEDLCLRSLCDSKIKIMGCGEACWQYINNSIVIGEEYDSPGHRAHELLHWLQFCAESYQDFFHEDIGVWGPPMGNRLYGGKGGLLEKLGG